MFTFSVFLLVQSLKYFLYLFRLRMCARRYFCGHKLINESGGLRSFDNDLVPIIECLKLSDDDRMWVSLLRQNAKP